MTDSVEDNFYLRGATLSVQHQAQITRQAHQSAHLSVIYGYISLKRSSWRHHEESIGERLLKINPKYRVIIKHQIFPLM